MVRVRNRHFAARNGILPSVTDADLADQKRMSAPEMPQYAPPVCGLFGRSPGCPSL